jgi:thiopurine S-methyltransferase
MAGPPFSVVDSEVQNIFAGVSPARIIDRRDILEKEPKFLAAGVSRLDTVVYHLGAQE